MELASDIVFIIFLCTVELASPETSTGFTCYYKSKDSVDLDTRRMTMEEGGADKK